MATQNSRDRMLLVANDAAAACPAIPDTPEPRPMQDSAVELDDGFSIGEPLLVSADDEEHAEGDEERQGDIKQHRSISSGKKDGKKRQQKLAGPRRRSAGEATQKPRQVSKLSDVY